MLASGFRRLWVLGLAKEQAALDGVWERHPARYLDVCQCSSRSNMVVGERMPDVLLVRKTWVVARGCREVWK